MLAHIAVLNRNDAVLVLNYGHFGADGVVEVGKFHTDGAGTHNDHALGLVLQGHRLAVADDVFAVLWNGGQLSAACSGGDDDVIRAQGLLFAGFICHLELLAREQFPVAHDDVDFVLLHQKLHALRHAVRDAAAALDHAAEVRLGLSDRDAVVFGVLDVLENVGALEQCFGGYASPVQTNSAKGFPFNNRCLESQLACADGRDVAARAATEYNDVVFHG